jgi:choline dehydrogenase
VGANLMEHPGTFLLAVPAPGVCDPDEVQFQLGVRAPRTEDADEGELFFGMMSYWDLSTQPELAARVGAPLVFALTCGVQRPRARGRVGLVRADALAPRVELNLLGHPEDLRRLRVALRTCRELSLQPALAPRIRRLALLDGATFADDAALDGYLRATCVPWYHPCGTARMGPDSDPDAVVDPSLRVRGVDGLRVADASVIPLIPRAPTNLTCIAIGERAAELVAAGA